MIGLHSNPFWILGASTRDNRRRIIELADEKLLHHDDEKYQKARQQLTAPRSRLSAEIAWLPGTSPAKTAQILGQLEVDPRGVRDVDGLPSLAHANVLAAACEGIQTSDYPEQIVAFVERLATTADCLDRDQILRDINEDRMVAGFPEVTTADLVDDELAERKRFYRKAVKDALDELPSNVIIDVMTSVVYNLTKAGVAQAPKLIDDLVDTYEVEAQGFLQAEAENLNRLIAGTRENAAKGEAVIKPLIDKLESILRKWDRVAQPVQLSFKSRGQMHGLSGNLAYGVRSLAVDLFNDHGLIEYSQRLTNIIAELFAEVPEVAERAEEDVEALEGILEKRFEAEAEREEWAREITYETTVGSVFGKPLAISPAGVRYGDLHFALEDITRVRWGGVRRSVNGIPTGTTYTIGFGDNAREAVVQFRGEQIFLAFTQRLFRTVGPRLMTEMLAKLRAGKAYTIGSIVLRDNAVILPRNKLWGQAEAVGCSWDDVKIWSESGSFFIAAKRDPKVRGSCSYIEDANTHLVEQAIRMAFERGTDKLSDLLN